MRNWLLFALAFFGVVVMLYVGFDALAANNARIGMFFTFVGSMTVIGLVIDFVQHVKTKRSM